jgi:hypothetical protein
MDYPLGQLALEAALLYAQREDLRCMKRTFNRPVCSMTPAIFERYE